MDIKHEHASILRETLAQIYKQVPHNLQQVIFTSLKKYGQAVKKYCDCPSQVFHPYEHKNCCLDCGARHEIEENVLPGNQCPAVIKIRKPKSCQACP